VCRHWSMSSKPKCEHKGIDLPTLRGAGAASGNPRRLLVEHVEAPAALAATLGIFLEGLPAFFDWLAGGQAPVVPAAYVGGQGETVLRERVLRLPIAPARQAHVEVIRFCRRQPAPGRTRLPRRRGSTHHTDRRAIFAAPDAGRRHHPAPRHDVGKNDHRGLRLDRIEGARVTNRSFTPRHQIELTPTGPVTVAPSTTRAPSTATRSTSGPFGTARPARAAVGRSSTGLSASGPTYVIQCPICQKKLNRKSYDTKLNAQRERLGRSMHGANWISGRYTVLIRYNYRRPCTRCWMA